MMMEQIWFKVKLLEQKPTHRLRKWTYGYRGEGWGEGLDWEFGIDMYTQLYLK